MTDPDRAHRQFTSTVRFDWGTSGASAIASGADVAVVVDVLSFTTTLTVAADAGTAVVPWAVGQASAAEYARRTDAVMAVRRRDAGPGDISLSPATLRAGTPPQRLVLPSPNGSTISAQLAAEVPVCTGVSLRNAPAAAQWIAANTDTDAVVAVIAAGEHWPNGALRPCIEDLWGAGFLLAELGDRRPDCTLSPEAEMARDAWKAVCSRLPHALVESASGRELIDEGYEIDVTIAAEVGSSRSVPVLDSGIFVDAGSHNVAGSHNEAV
ncbi:2-phosphosulfolactate phosphatase [Rhodococcoides fascians]|uniref:2-phosphosulfolactate phosphatase n=1 Tax=Rhodococcoides fascians TaxID=1828 RepID=UPI00056AB68D|nr:2-phosphosulfolactate phosphatase [Rhodococcus fascians]